MMNAIRTYTFTFFTEDDKVYGYRHDITRAEAQMVAEMIHVEEGVYVYYMEGYYE